MAGSGVVQGGCKRQQRADGRVIHLVGHLDGVDLDAFIGRVEVLVGDAESAGSGNLVGGEVVADVLWPAHGRRDLRVVVGPGGGEHGFHYRCATG